MLLNNGVGPFLTISLADIPISPLSPKWPLKWVASAKGWSVTQIPVIYKIKSSVYL